MVKIAVFDEQYYSKEEVENASNQDIINALILDVNYACSYDFKEFQEFFNNGNFSEECYIRFYNEEE